MKTLSIVTAVYVEESPLPSYKFAVIRQQHINCFDTHVQAEQQVTAIGGTGYFYKSIRYNYYVIKEITLQLHPNMVREEWFKWDGNAYSYVVKPAITI